MGRARPAVEAFGSVRAAAKEVHHQAHVLVAQRIFRVSEHT
jgi:hypothetical protein